MGIKWNFTILLYLVSMNLILLLVSTGETLGGSNQSLFYELSNDGKCNATLLRDHRYKVVCSGLTSVPTAGEISVDSRKVIQLVLRNNAIKQLPNKVFQHFVKLKVLDMSNNPLERCKNGSFSGLSDLTDLILSDIKPDVFLSFDRDTFRPMKSLRIINVSSSVVHRSSLFYSLCSVVSELDHLILNNAKVIQHTKLIDLNDKLTQCFAKIKIKKLSADFCQVRSLSFGSVLNIRHLEYLSFSNNEIIMEETTLFLSWMTAHNMSYFDGSCQDARGCDGKYPWNDWLPNQPFMFPHMNISLLENEQQLVPNSNVTEVYFLKYFQRFKLQRVFGAIVTESYFPSFCWRNNHLVNLDLSHLPGVHFLGTIYCMQHLRFLNFRGIKNLVFKMEVFSAVPNLEVLLLGSSKIKNSSIFFESNYTEIFTKNENLQFVDLSNLGLQTLHRNVFKQQQSIKTLILRNNKFKSFENGTLNLTSLQYLDLAYNLLREIPANLIQELSQISKHRQSYKTVLYLIHNPFFCDCHTIKNIHVMLKSSVIIEDLRNPNGSLRCTLVSGESMSFPEALESLQRECMKSNSIYLVCLEVVYPFILFIISTSVLAYGYRWKIKYFLYIVWEMIRTKKAVQLRDELLFDAFVSYSENDEAWVRTQLLLKLEEKPNNYHLCIQDRNFLPGQFIADSIISAIEKSKKTILIVTKSFVRSKWCTFESRVAVDHHLKKQTGLIVIMLPGAKKLAGKYFAIDNLLNYSTCLEWTESEETQAVFWLRLCQEIGTPIPKPEHDLHEFFILG